MDKYESPGVPETTTSLLLQPGDIVKGTSGKRWKVHAALGKGTCCTVFHVQIVGEEVRGALKLYKMGARYEGAHARETTILRLARTAYGALPLIAEIYDSFTYKGHSCLVQELCECDLRGMMSKQMRKGLSLYLIQTLARDILRGLKLFHNKGFVHADVKPSNLMWSPESGCMLLVDFGLSFHVDDEVIGQCQSPGYRAPEMERWNQFIAASSDAGQGTSHGRCNCDSPEKTETIPETERETASCNDKSKDASDSLMMCESIRSRSLVLQSALVEKETIGEEAPGTNKHDLLAGNAPCWNSICRRKKLGVGTAADTWSVGRLLAEMYTGKKLFDRDTCGKLLAAQSLVESNNFVAKLLSKLFELRGEDEQVGEFLLICKHLKDLVQKLLITDPAERISVESALQHGFFSDKIEPKFDDLIVLPTSVLRLLNVVDTEDLEDEESRKDTLQDLEMEFVKFGHVMECIMPNSGPGRGKVFVQYEHAQQAMTAYSRLCGRTFADRSILMTYFSLSDFCVKNLY